MAAEADERQENCSRQTGDRRQGGGCEVWGFPFLTLPRMSALDHFDGGGGQVTMRKKNHSGGRRETGGGCEVWGFPPGQAANKQLSSFLNTLGKGRGCFLKTYFILSDFSDLKCGCSLQAKQLSSFLCALGKGRGCFLFYQK